MTAVAAIALAGCGGAGGTVSEADAAETAKQLLIVELDRMGEDSSALVGVECVRDHDNVFSCIARGTDGSSVGGTLTCNDGRCLWRGELRGG